MIRPRDETAPRADGARFYSWITADSGHICGWFVPGVPPARAVDCTGMDDDMFYEHVNRMDDLAEAISWLKSDGPNVGPRSAKAIAALLSNVQGGPV